MFRTEIQDLCVIDPRQILCMRGEIPNYKGNAILIKCLPQLGDEADGVAERGTQWQTLLLLLLLLVYYNLTQRLTMVLHPSCVLKLDEVLHMY